jgi:hypothetical protein
MAGGATSASVTAADVVKAGNFAVTAQATKSGKTIELVKITQAQKQVVAGMNYIMTLSVKENGIAKTANATVYQNLQSQMSLTSWQ